MGPPTEQLGAGVVVTRHGHDLDITRGGGEADRGHLEADDVGRAVDDHVEDDREVVLGTDPVHQLGEPPKGQHLPHSAVAQPCPLTCAYPWTTTTAAGE